MYFKIQVVLDAADPARLAEFWALALDYVLEPPPHGFETWEDFGRSIGMPEEEFGDRGIGRGRVVQAAAPRFPFGDHPGVLHPRLGRPVGSEEPVFPAATDRIGEGDDCLPRGLVVTVGGDGSGTGHA